MARKDALARSLARQPDGAATFGAFVDNPAYTYGKLPLFYLEKTSFESEHPEKPIFQSRVPGGGDFSKRGAVQSPCNLNLIDILDVKRHWTVMEDQDIKKGTMAKKFHVTAKDTDFPDTNPAEVPLNLLSQPMLERCEDASHSHHPSYHFPMGVKSNERANLLALSEADAEVGAIMSSPDRGHGDARNESRNMNGMPTRTVKNRALSPNKLARSQSVQSMMTSGTMMSERTFSSPGLPDDNIDKSGFLCKPMGLPHITFAKKPKPPKMKPWMTRRGSLTTVKSTGWKERDLTKSQSSLGL